MDEITEYRKRWYAELYPEMDLDKDDLDRHAIVMYTRDQHGDINSTGRLVLENPIGFPQDMFLADYRARQMRIVEWGRFIIQPERLNLLMRYYKLLFWLQECMRFDAIVMSLQPRHLQFNLERVGMDLVEEHTGITYGGANQLACVVWDFNKTNKRFYEKCFGAEHEYYAKAS